MTVTAVILVAYASLVIELTVLRVPSVASSLRILAPAQSIVETFSAPYRRLFRLGTAAKVALFVLPLLAVYAVFLYPFAVISAGPDPFGDYLFKPAAFSNALGIAAIVAGRVIALAAVLTVRKDNAQVGNAFRLHTAGVFAWSRNPGLVGMYVFVIGLWLTMPAASLLAGILVYIAYMDFKVRMEEDFLESKFGEAYTAYRLKTGRYLQ